MARRSSEGLRTTVTLPADVSRRLRDLAGSRGVAEAAAIRFAVERYLDSVDELERQARVVGPSSVLELGELSSGLSNPYQRLVADWRTDRTLRQVREIASFRLELHTYPAALYLVKVLTELLQFFNAKDEFLVVTSVDFWRAEGVLGPEWGGQYLLAQKSAVARGMRLVRVLLLSPDDRPEHRQSVVETHVRFLRDLQVDSSSNVEVLGLLYQKQPDKPRMHEFACIRRRITNDNSLEPWDQDGGCLIVEPVYWPDGQDIRYVRLMFSQGSGTDDPEVRFYLDRFYHAREGARPLDQIDLLHPGTKGTRTEGT